MDERRRAERLPVTIPIELRGGTGITRDLSGLGVYFSSSFPFESGEDIEFVLRIPDSINVRCSGRVVRSDYDREAMSYGVAMTIDAYSGADGETGDSATAELVLRELRKHHG